MELLCCCKSHLTSKKGLAFCFWLLSCPTSSMVYKRYQIQIIIDESTCTSVTIHQHQMHEECFAKSSDQNILLGHRRIWQGTCFARYFLIIYKLNPILFSRKRLMNEVIQSLEVYCSDLRWYQFHFEIITLCQDLIQYGMPFNSRILLIISLSISHYQEDLHNFCEAGF